MEKIGATDRYVAYADSQIGKRNENQDCCKGLLLDSGDMVLVVCDGMGGSVGGSTASYLAAETVIASLQESLADRSKRERIEACLAEAIHDANMAVYNCALNDVDLMGMGTTAVILVLTREAAFVAHVGDSRLYLLRRGAKRFRTFDHSFVMENFVRNGLRSEEWARTAPNANIITRALGLKKDTVADIMRLPYRRGDRFILCCDGVWNALPESNLLRLFNAKTDTADELQALMQRIDEVGQQSGKEYDNFTAIIADMKCSSVYQYSFLVRLRQWRSACCAKVKGCFRKRC